MQNQTIKVQSPTRIDLAGGTLDCWPINAILNPVSTINVAISAYTSCTLSPREDGRIIIRSKDWDQSYEFDSLEQALNDNEEHFIFFREHLAYWKPETGFEMECASDSPVGGGLGGSSSLSISIFKAFAQWMGVEIEPYSAVRTCSGIEAKILKTPTGTQDYFPPLLGGVNIIDYEFGWPQVQSLPIDKAKISGNISIFFTGRAHQSGINNWQVMKKFIEGDAKTVNALTTIQKIADETKMAVIEADWQRLPDLFQREFAARMDLAESFSSPEIEDLAKIALENGGEAIKICGAGGGGCVFVWSQPEHRQQVVDACVRAGYKHLDVQLI